LRPGRFGVATLSLGTGYLLATLWADALAWVIPTSELAISGSDAAYVVLLLAPTLLVLVLSQKRQGVVPRLVSAVALALLITALLLPVLSIATIMDPGSRSLYETAEQYREVVISVVLVLGLLDVLFSRPTKAP